MKMDIFLSAESAAPSAYLLSQMNQIVSKEFNTLKSKNYGDELKSIAIITILLPDKLYEGGGYPERKLFQRKQCAADIRLRVDFRTFLRASPEKRYRMYCEHILSSVETLRHKVSKNFLFHELVYDISEILYSQHVHDACILVKRFP